MDIFSPGFQSTTFSIPLGAELSTDHHDHTVHAPSPSITETFVCTHQLI